MITREKILTEGKYILVGKVPQPVEDLLDWARWYEAGNRRVAQTKIKDSTVSTVFLGMDMNFHFLRMQPDSKPLFFETMVFGGHEDGYCERTSTWDEAVAAHNECCKQVKRSVGD